MNSSSALLSTSFSCACEVSKTIPLFLVIQKCFHSTGSSFPLAWGNSATSNPALRNIAVPHQFSSKKRKNDALPPDIIKKKVEKILLQQLQQEVLWEGSVIDDPQHHLVSHFVELCRNPKYRNARRMMCVMGEKLIREIYEQGNTPHHLLLPEGAERPKWAPPPCMDEEGKGTDVVHVSARVTSSCFSGSDGYIGDFQIPDPPPKESLITNKQQMERVLVLDNVDDPGSLGTLIRTAAGFHYDAIILTNHCADLFDQQVIRAARGAHFQKAVPIYGLHEEDGDDVDSMLNHIIARNDLAPILYAGKPDLSCRKRLLKFHPYPSSINFQLNVHYSTAMHRSSSVAHPFPLPTPLSEFCLQSFSKPPNEQSKGIMLFCSPNRKRNVHRRLSQRIARPLTTVCVEHSSRDFLISSSTVLYALRPSGNWDYLPTSPSAPQQQELQKSPSRASVDIGPNRLVIGEKDISWDEAEQKENAHLVNECKKHLRMRRRQKTDYDFWMDAEKARIRKAMKNYKRKLQFPWKLQPIGKSEEVMPSWVPNIIDEYKQSPDRDYMRQAKEDAQKFTRPPNYNV